MTNEPDDFTVFVVDDDPGTRASIDALVESLGIPCESFPSAEAFLDAYQSSRPGCLVTDLIMEGMNGLTLQERLVAEGAPLPVIVISAYADVQATVRAMQNGALTLLEKPYPAQELTNAIRRAIRLSIEKHHQMARRRQLQERLAHLTPNEEQVMHLLVKGFSNKAIAEQLELGLRTVERRRHHLLEKMGVRSLAELARLVAEMQVAPPPPPFES